MMFNVYYAHIVPGLSAVLNFALTDVVIIRGHVKMVVVIALIYGYVNYLETMARGKPLYWFLTWEDETSFYIYAGLMALFSILWLAICQMTRALKPRPVDKPKKL